MKPLIDSFGRVHTDLRISVTDRCNIRCFYCMPAENVRFKPRSEILTFEELERFVRVVARMGDLHVPIHQSRMMEDRLKDAGKTVQLVVYPDLDHGLQDGVVRADVLRKVDAFFRANFGG